MNVSLSPPLNSGGIFFGLNVQIFFSKFLAI
jgi:hypothetical protein